jgi:hypothetical protein
LREGGLRSGIAGEDIPPDYRKTVLRRITAITIINATNMVTKPNVVIAISSAGVLISRRKRPRPEPEGA